MCKKNIMLGLLLIVVTIVAIVLTGCAYLVEAAARDGMDHGKHASIENKHFRQHFKDAILEDLGGMQSTIDRTKRK